MKLSTGNRPLDELLDGGIEYGAITNVSGGPGTGKTNVCLLSALEALKQGKKVIYIDTEGGFSIDRVRQLNPDIDLKKIMFFEPKTFEEQRQVIDKLPEATKTGEIGLIVLDSAVALYRLEYAETDHVIEANRELGKQLSLLSYLSRERNLPVLITNHIFKKFDTERIELIGGDSVKYWSKAIVQIERKNQAGLRTAILMKHRSLPEGRHVEFQITERGIEIAEKKFGLF